MSDKQPSTTRHFRNIFRIKTKCVPIFSLMLFLSLVTHTYVYDVNKYSVEKMEDKKISQNVDIRTKTLETVRKIKKLDDLFWNFNIQTRGF